MVVLQSYRYFRLYPEDCIRTKLVVSILSHSKREVTHASCTRFHPFCGFHILPVNTDPDAPQSNGDISYDT